MGRTARFAGASEAALLVARAEALDAFDQTTVVVAPPSTSGDAGRQDDAVARVVPPAVDTVSTCMTSSRLK
jgi:hypothetical protein